MHGEAADALAGAARGPARVAGDHRLDRSAVRAGPGPGRSGYVPTWSGDGVHRVRLRRTRGASSGGAARRGCPPSSRPTPWGWRCRPRERAGQARDGRLDGLIHHYDASSQRGLRWSLQHLDRIDTPASTIIAGAIRGPLRDPRVLDQRLSGGRGRLSAWSSFGRPSPQRLGTRGGRLITNRCSWPEVQDLLGQVISVVGRRGGCVGSEKREDRAMRAHGAS